MNLFLAGCLCVVGGNLAKCQQPVSGVGQTLLPRPPNQRLLNSLFNSVQMGLKNLVDQVVPNIQLPRLLPNGQDVQVGDLTIPTIFGMGRLTLTNCPNCENLNPSKLNGTWYMLYANDNFLKTQMYTLAHLARGYVRVIFPSTQSGFGYQPTTVRDVFNPIRYPVCVKFEIKEPVSAGYVSDYPVTISFREGRPTSKLLTLEGFIRQVNQGIYLMVFGNGTYYIRFCATDANFIIYGGYPPQPEIFTSEAPAVSESLDSNRTNTSQKTFRNDENVRHRYMILSDTTGFPGCNNYVILTTDEEYYYNKFDRKAMNFLKRMAADSNANPLQFIGCNSAQMR